MGFGNCRLQRIFLKTYSDHSGNTDGHGSSHASLMPISSTGIIIIKWVGLTSTLTETIKAWLMSEGGMFHTCEALKEICQNYKCFPLYGISCNGYVTAIYRSLMSFFLYSCTLPLDNHSSRRTNVVASFTFQTVLHLQWTLPAMTKNNLVLF